METPSHQSFHTMLLSPVLVLQVNNPAMPSTPGRFAIWLVLVLIVVSSVVNALIAWQDSSLKIHYITAYRPISLTPTLCKLMEKLEKTNRLPFFVENIFQTRKRGNC